MKQLTVTDQVWNQAQATVLNDTDGNHWILFGNYVSEELFKGCYVRLMPSSWKGRWSVGFGKKGDTDWQIPPNKVELVNTDDREIRPLGCHIELRSIGEVYTKIGKITPS